MGQKGYTWFIAIISIAVPLVVALLLFNSRQEEADGAAWIYFLPHMNAMINSITALILVAGYVLIKKGNRDWHKTAMISAFILGTLFLVSYITYHSNAPSTVFGDLDKDGFLSTEESDTVGSYRLIYLVVLLTHIFLAAIVVPFVLFAMYFALKGKFERHKKIVKFTFPIWLYVSISGVIVYLMISQYY
jgi:putative membrane protein